MAASDPEQPLLHDSRDSDADGGAGSNDCHAIFEMIKRAMSSLPWSRAFVSELVALLVSFLGLTFLERCGRSEWRKHYVGSGHDMVWVPVPGCSLQPPEPFWMESIFLSVLTLLMAKCFGAPTITSWSTDADVVPETLKDYMPSLARRLEHIKGWRLKLIYAIFIYQVAIFVGSLVSMWYDFFQQVGFNDRWDKYSCWAIMLTEGPWFGNCTQTIVQFYLTSHLLRVMEQWAEGAENRDQRWDKGQGSLTRQKMYLCKYLCYGTVSVFGLHCIPVFCTHVLPSILVSPPIFPAFLLFVGMFLSWKLGAVSNIELS